jgi:hypothetical protein
MATATSIITDALKEIGVVADGETPSSSESSDGLRALNRLMALWSNDQSFAWVANTVSKPLTGQSSYTIGPTGDVVATRPISIETATVVRDGITYPVQVVDNQKWDSISYKAANGANTSIIYYAAEVPNGIVNVWPIATGCTLNVRVINLVTSFPDLGTDVTLPPGYEEAFIKNLAVNLAPSYKAQVDPLTLKAAQISMRSITRTNNVIPTMSIDSSLMGIRGGSLPAFLGGY